MKRRKADEKGDAEDGPDGISLPVVLTETDIDRASVNERNARSENAGAFDQENKEFPQLTRIGDEEWTFLLSDPSHSRQLTKVYASVSRSCTSKIVFENDSGLSISSQVKISSDVAVRKRARAVFCPSQAAVLVSSSRFHLTSKKTD